MFKRLFSRPVKIKVTRNVQAKLQVAAEVPTDPRARAELLEAILESFAHQAPHRGVGYHARQVLKTLRSARGGNARQRPGGGRRRQSK